MIGIYLATSWDICVLMFLYCVSSRLFLGGGESTNLWWGGGPFYRFLWFLRVVSLCGAASVILVWGRVFYKPGELCPTLLFGSTIVLEEVV